MFQYKACYKFVDGGVHAQVLDMPVAISFSATLDDARKMLGLALVDATEGLLDLGDPLPRPNPLASDPDMDVEEPIFLHLVVSSDQTQTPADSLQP